MSAIGKFWMVTDPTRLSVLADIAFETDVEGLARQVKGGLDVEREHGMLYLRKDEAELDASARLALRDLGDRMRDGMERGDLAAAAFIHNTVAHFKRESQS